MFRFMDFGTYYYLLLILAGFGLVFYFRYTHSKLKVEKLFSKRLTKFYFSELSSISYGLIRVLLVTSGLLFAVIALFRPQYGSQKLELNAEGVELVFVVDVSQSMASEDVKPQRLKLAQIQLKKLAKILDGNRMGIVAFAGQVGVISPLTQDLGAIDLFIDSLDFNIFSEQGTNIGFALQEAKELLERGKSDQVQQRSKVVILVTDGEDHSGEALRAVKQLKDNDIRTFVVGVGTATGGKIPIKDGYNQVTGYVQDRSGSDVVSKPNFSFLKELSKAGAGGFYKLDFGSAANSAIAKDFENLRKSKFESQSFEVKGEYFQLFIAIALVLLLMSQWSSENKVTQKIGSLLELEDE